MQNAVQIVAVPIIVTIVYFSLEVYKKITGGQEKFLRFIPLVACLVGVSLGIIGFYAVPEIVPASNLLVAILIGGASGLAATGTNQIFKQMTKGKDTNETDNEKKVDEKDNQNQ